MDTSGLEDSAAAARLYADSVIAAVEALPGGASATVMVVAHDVIIVTVNLSSGTDKSAVLSAICETMCEGIVSVGDCPATCNWTEMIGRRLTEGGQDSARRPRRRAEETDTVTVVRIYDAAASNQTNIGASLEQAVADIPGASYSSSTVTQLTIVTEVLSTGAASESQIVASLETNGTAIMDEAAAAASVPLLSTTVVTTTPPLPPPRRPFPFPRRRCRRHRQRRHVQTLRPPGWQPTA